MQHNIFVFACLNFELTSSKDLWTRVAAMKRKGLVLRSMGNELVPSPLVLRAKGVSLDMCI